MRSRRGVRLVAILLSGAVLSSCQLTTPSSSTAPAPSTTVVSEPTSATAVATPTRAPTAQPGAMLSDLAVQIPAGTGSALTPAFSPDVTEYSMRVDSDISAVGVVASPAGGDGVRIEIAGQVATLGQASVVSVGVGSSRVEVEVTAADGTARSTYAIEIERRDMTPVIDRFQKLSFTDSATGETMGYRLFVPDGYDRSKSYPLVLFLHGAGERGSDNEAQLTANEGATVWATPEEQAKHPAFVLAPQSGSTPKTEGWTTIATHGQNDPFRPQKELVTAFDILQRVTSEYSVDAHRIYVTGVSQGGFGTYAIAIAHPQEFAALVPICGGGDPAKLAAIAQVPIWIFHAAKDPTVRAGYSRNSVAALKKAGGHPRYTEYPADAYFYPTAHASWTTTYANQEMRDWLFDQSR